MGIRYEIRVFAIAVCSRVGCDKEGPIAMVPLNHDNDAAVVQLNSTRPHNAAIVGPGGEWYCSSCKTPAVEPRR